MSSRTISVTLRSIATTFLYALTDPRPGDTHVYVGKSNDPKHRNHEHSWERDNTNNRKANWLRCLKRLGLKPVLEILREVPVDEWIKWERDYIHWYRVLGWRVVNTTEGGEGLQNPTPEVRAKCGEGFRGRTHTPEARAAIGAAARGRPQSAETRARQSAAKRGVNHPMFGKRHSPEHCANISAGNPWKGKRMSAERRARYIEARNRKATLTSQDSCAFLFL